jgi:hypothetical protein
MQVCEQIVVKLEYQMDTPVFTLSPWFAPELVVW